jgi:hypothetical protein
MDTQINTEQLLLHFNIKISDVYEKYRDLISSFGPSFSARQLCENLINQYWNLHKIPLELQDCNDYCNTLVPAPLDPNTFSVFALACRYLGKLNPNMIERTKHSVGIIAYQNQPDDSDEAENFVAIRDIVPWMISQS